jgi:sec-independent protein translocase protein TatB
MFGIGFSELVVIGVILIVAVGPERMPGMLRAAMRAYREFRKATRDLRATTGIDDLLQDEELRDLRKPLQLGKPLQAATRGAAPKSASKPALSFAERMQESPRDGVDIATVRDREARPSPEEAARIRAEKEAASAEEQRIVAAKIAAAQQRDPALDDDDEEGQRIIAAKIAAARQRDPALDDDDEEGQRIIAAKIAAAQQRDPALDDDDEEGQRIIAAKIAAAQQPGAEGPAGPQAGGSEET